MRSSQAARGLLPAVGRAATATGADRLGFGLEADGVATSPFADLTLSGVAFLAVKGATASEAGSAARAAISAAEAGGRGADAAATAGTASEAALCAGTAGAVADDCGGALLVDVMAAKVCGPALVLESNLKAAPATTSAAKPATSQTALRGEAT